MNAQATTLYPFVPSGPRFEEAIKQFATLYADQTERDHKQLCDAIADGSVPAEAGW